MSDIYLGFRTATGFLDNTGNNPYGLGFFTARFDPKIMGTVPSKFEIYHMAINGPVGSSMQVYIDTTFYDITSRGDQNSWDPSQPMVVSDGQNIVFYWNSNGSSGQGPTGVIPSVSIWLREITVVG